MNHRSNIESASLGLAERIIAILDEGRFTATYKFAVLIGLMDLCMEQCQRSGAAPTTLTTRQLAEKFVELYWPHTSVFDHMDEPRVLWQNAAPKGSQAAIIRNILDFRSRYAPDPTSTLYRSRLAAPKKFELLINRIEWTLIRYPLPRLQYMGPEETRFLYQIAWTRMDTEQSESTLRSSVAAYQRGHSSTFDNRIDLFDGVGDLLIRLNGLLRPLIFRQWADKVAQINNLDRLKLERFLFDNSRINTTKLRVGLHEIQHGVCLYCGKRILNTDSTHVDHFIPRARYASDDLANLVLAHRGCNGAKKDYLAAVQHLSKWHGRFENESELAQVAADAEWELEIKRVEGMARAVYTRLPDETPLWVRRSDFEPAVRSTIVEVLG